MEGLGINWKILIGQIVNFAILFYLLKRFAFKPFLALLEKRRVKIEDGMKKSAEAEASLQRIKELGRTLLAEKEKKASELIKKGELRAKEMEKKIIEEAEEEKSRIIDAAKKTMDKEIVREREAREKKMVEGVFFLAEKFLKEKHNQENDKKFIEELVSDLK
ncbi:MAG: F0F1 ATP synthase subunit B [bacterium]